MKVDHKNKQNKAKQFHNYLENTEKIYYTLHKRSFVHILAFCRGPSFGLAGARLRYFVDYKRSHDVILREGITLINEMLTAIACYLSLLNGETKKVPLNMHYFPLLFYLYRSSDSFSNGEF